MTRAKVGLEPPPLRTAALAFGLALAVAGGAWAQVLEIAPDGSVTTYNGPGVYSSGTFRRIAEFDPPPVPAERSRADVVRELHAAAARHRLQPELVSAVARKESALRQDRRSPKGAVGVMQLMPATAQTFHVDAADLSGNVEGGAAYLAALLDRYGGDVRTALAAYNAGPNAVRRYGGPPPFAETKAYVNAVMADWIATTRKAGDTRIVK